MTDAGKDTGSILKKEEEFHDKWAESVDIDSIPVIETFEASTMPENRHILGLMGDIRGKKILDLGCGLGEAAVYLAIKGADVTASDLSGGMLEVVKRLAKKHGVTVKTLKSPSNALNVEDGSFDFVYSSNLLHHVDLDPTIAEVSRVLKKGGMFLSWDPLEYNPAIQVYRKIASEVRTPDEHPFLMRDLDIFRKHFSGVSYETFWFFPLLIFFKFYFWDRVNPNKERYWKKIVTDHKKVEGIYRPLAKLDRIFFRIFPFMKRYCWTIVVAARK